MRTTHRPAHRTTPATVGSAARATIAGVLLLGVLSGCSAAIVDRSDDATAASPRPSATPAANAPSVEAPEKANTPSATSPSSAAGLSPENAADRERMLAQASTTMPCPSGPLDQDGAVIRVEGACAELVIDIDAGVVIADDVTKLTLSGSGTVVYAETIGDLTVTGSASMVLWTGGTPTVDDRGSANTLRHG